MKDAKDFFKEEWAEELGRTINADKGFDGGGGPYGAGIDAGGVGGYSGGGCGENVMSPVEEREDLTILEGISKMNVVTIQLHGRGQVIRTLI